MVVSLRFTRALERTQRQGSGCGWSLSTLAADRSDDVETFANEVAALIMWNRCRGAGHVFSLWIERVLSHDPTTDSDRRRLVPFIQTTFGLPESPLSDEHIQGLVSEYLYWCVAIETDLPTEALLRISDPPFDVTGHGGDGLSVHRSATNQLFFRLWEVKKHVSAAPVSRAVGRAYDQLDSNALSYLARLTSLAETEPDIAIRELYSRLVDIWADAESEAGAGVAVATSYARAPRRCYSTMASRFAPIDSSQLAGQVNAIGDFAGFCAKVRDRVWLAL